MNAQTQVQSPMNLPAPLGVAKDMRPLWSDVDCDYDTAAEQLVTAHKEDGLLRDLPVMDLRTWGLKADKGQFALAPLAGHEPARPLRANAFSQLSNRLGRTSRIRSRPVTRTAATGDDELPAGVGSAGHVSAVAPSW